MKKGINKKIIIVLFFGLINFSLPVCAQQNMNISPVFPKPRNVQVYPGRLSLSNFWEIAVLESNPQISQAVKYFNQQLSEIANYQLPVIMADQPRKRQLIVGLNNSAGLKKWGIRAEPLPNDQGYILQISLDNIFIIGEDAAGVFYGVQSLLQLLKHGEMQLPVVRIVDYPQNKIRAVHFCAGDFTDIEKQLEFLATLKINAVILDSWLFFNLEKPENQNRIQKAKQTADKYFIEIIPEIQSFGAPGGVLMKDPYCVEAEYVDKQPFRFVADRAQAQTDKNNALINVIKTDTSLIVVQSVDDIVYKEGQDYQVILGKIKPKFKDRIETQILRLKDGNIQPGQKVLISYDQVLWLDSFAEWKIPYCPSEPRTYAIMFSALKNIQELLKPRFVSIGHDEIRGMNKDSRCLKRKMSNAELLADEINKLNAYAKNLDPDLRLLMWDDMINPWHNGSNENYQVSFHGAKGATKEAIELISKDVLMMVWWTEASDWLHKMEHSLDYFQNHGFEFFVFCYDNEENIKKWVRLINGRKDCLGIICASWQGFDQSKKWFKKTADWAWQGPAKESL